MFRGNHPAKVDEKGRLKLPAAFKQLLDAQNVTQFYITSTDGRSAEIWPLPEWEKREAQLAGSSNLDDAVQKYGKARLDADVAVFGKTTYLEVHNREMFEQNLSGNEMTVDDRKALASILSRRVDY